MWRNWSPEQLKPSICNALFMNGSLNYVDLHWLEQDTVQAPKSTCLAFIEGIGTIGPVEGHGERPEGRSLAMKTTSYQYAMLPIYIIYMSYGQLETRDCTTAAVYPDTWGSEPNLLQS